MKRVSIVGGSGYAAGELLRLLTQHPQVALAQVTSRSQAGRPLQRVHPQLRGLSLPNFCEPASLEPADILFLALPHGEAMREIDRYTQLAPQVIDLSADFRLNSAEDYRQWYGAAHIAPHWLNKFAYGLPEVNRAALTSASHASGVGCNAAAVILALLPLQRAGLLLAGRPIVAEVKTGSSEGGAQESAATHHPVRSGVVRSYAPVGHRHTAEVQQALGLADVHLSLTAVELVRGALATVHAFTPPGTTEQDLWRAYRSTYQAEPFVRIVREAHGLYRRPEPKLLAGTNFADVSFDLDARTGRVVSVCALDNLMKGAAGSAVQCMNIMCGFDETTALAFRGLHPV